MRKEKEKTINGTKFRVVQLGFEDGIDLLVTLYKTLGPSLGVFMAGLERKDSKSLGDTEVSMSGMRDALLELAQRLNASDLKLVVSTLAKTTRVNREGEKWPLLEPEVDLAGEYGLMFKWLAFALEVNYSGFFDGAASPMGGLAAALQTLKPSASPSTSDGKYTA